MKTVKPNPEFTTLSEEEILAALDAYEAQFDGVEDEENADITPEDPIVVEVARLISEYTNRFDEYCGEDGELSEDVLNYEPDSVIEQVAFEIFTDALHDALQEEDDDE